MKDYLKFDKMITPIIIQILFWIGVVGAVLTGVGQIIGGLNSNYGGGGMVFMGLITTLVGPILVRVYCETLIVLFNINGNLSEAKELLKQKS